MKKENRCAIYTRKSTEAGLDSDFSSLDAQREACEAFIKSQKHEGWRCLATKYDDGGFTGGNTDRPGLQRLIADIEAGLVDCVVVYKVDRLSRALMDFAQMMGTFDKHGVSFVSVTQQFNTTHSMGRLTLNILFSFAQFEREIISERTRDKIAAARRKGKYIGGRPLLGYDVVDCKLVVNELEAEQVRTIFARYLELESLLATAKEINERGWFTKSWRTRKGDFQQGCEFNKTRLYALLTNVIYIGQVTYRDEVHNGEHQGIVEKKTFKQVQRLLGRNGKRGGPRNKYGALLQGLLKCDHCNCAMGHTFSSKGSRRYRYYVCQKAQKNGWNACPSPSISAPKIENLIVEEVRAIGQKPGVVAATLAHTRRQQQELVAKRKRERDALTRQCAADEKELVRLATSELSDTEQANQMAIVQDRINDAMKRIGQITRELSRIDTDDFEESEIESSLANFGEVWESLSPKERVKVVHMLVERVGHDPATGNIAIALHDLETAQ